jgi:ADP-glucose pyrophosphorylase
MAVILAGGEGRTPLDPVAERAVGRPAGGKYRIIDFTPSNCVNPTSMTSSC